MGSHQSRGRFRSRQAIFRTRTVVSRASAACCVATLSWAGTLHAASGTATGGRATTPNAEQPAPEPRARDAFARTLRQPPTVSYATPLAAAYAISIGTDAALWSGLGLPNSSSAREPLIIGAFLGWPGTLIAPATVHWVNGELGRGFLAIGGSLGSFAIGAVSAAYVTSTQDDSPGTWVPVGLGFGFLFQAIWACYDVDARSTRRAAPPGRASAEPRIPELRVARTRGGALLELGGDF